MLTPHMRREREEEASPYQRRLVHSGQGGWSSLII